MFKITGNKGFHMTFANGYTVSVQFGAGNYSDNYDLSFKDEVDGVPPSSVAEFPAWGPDHAFIAVDDKEIHGYITTDEALRLMNEVAQL